MARNGTGGLDELSRTLRQLREAAGPGRKLLLTEAAELAGRGFSTAKISRIENGKTVPSVEDVARLATAYKAPAETRKHLRTLAEAVKASNRRIVLARRPDRAAFQKRLADLTASSGRVVEFSPIIVPGLCQTAEYMRAVWDTGGGSAAEGAQFVANRLAAQAVLGDPGKQIVIITTEGALGWAAGSAGLMVRQLEHIAAVSEQPGVRVGVIPFGRPAQVFPVSNWTLYDERAVVPGILANQTVLNDPDTRPYVDQLERLEPLAVYGADAREILRRAADRYRAV